ncbi:hypothetical protein [Gilvimarinus chinensis]|uniref:hypothetical protein n=1 Tax=Gilvimarinus chinensis TaxID=396005 RepID=UPI000372C01B|nr:hypothetical protein [Gilvimarinus chinensis]
MATINFRCSDELKEDLSAEAKKLGFTSLSEYMVSLVQGRTAAPKPKKSRAVLTPVGVNGVAAKTRVTPDEKRKLVELAQSEGESESFILLRQIRILITNGPHFSKAELAALRAATNQLTAIGRNLNQILIKINSGQLKDSPLTYKYIGQIKDYVAEQAGAVRDLSRKTKQRVVE